jgi:signal transduction histidine kinase
MAKYRFASASELVHEIVEMLCGEISEEGREIVEDIHEVPPSLFRVNELYTVVLNLLVNARARVREGGKIHVRVASKDRDVIIEVAYEGDPMEPEIVEEILETADPEHVYLRGPETPKDFPFRVTCSMIRGMGGKVEASEVEGGGTRVTVALPFVGDRRKTQIPVDKERRKGDNNSNLSPD